MMNNLCVVLMRQQTRRTTFDWFLHHIYLFLLFIHIFVRRLYTIHIYIYRVYFCGLFVLIFVTVHRAASKSLTEFYLWYWKLTPRNHVVNNINIYTECSSTRNLCAFNSKPKNQIPKRIKQIIVNQSVSQSINVIFARHLVGLDWILEILLRSLTKHSNLFNIFLDNCMHRRFWSFVASYFKLHQSNDKLLHTHPQSETTCILWRSMIHVWRVSAWAFARVSVYVLWNIVCTVEISLRKKFLTRGTIQYLQSIRYVCKGAACA